MTDQDHRAQGFTLIELMIVLFILGLLATLVAPRFMGRVGKAKQKTTQAQIQMLTSALDLFHLDVGRYPTEEEGLKVLVQRPDNVPGWAGPYLDKALPKDPWGRDYIYKSPGSEGRLYEIISYGADGQPGGEEESADLTSYQSSP